jgi:hypothetical protein
MVAARVARRVVEEEQVRDDVQQVAPAFARLPYRCVVPLIQHGLAPVRDSKRFNQIRREFLVRLM